MKPDQERVRSLLTDTVTLLCKNGLHFSKELKVEGVLGITLDDNDVFIVHINEKITEQCSLDMKFSNDCVVIPNAIGNSCSSAMQQNNCVQGLTESMPSPKGTRLVHMRSPSSFKRRRKEFPSKSKAYVSNYTPNEAALGFVKLEDLRHLADAGNPLRDEHLVDKANRGHIPMKEESTIAAVDTRTDTPVVEILSDFEISKTDEVDDPPNLNGAIGLDLSLKEEKARNINDVQANQKSYRDKTVETHSSESLDISDQNDNESFQAWFHGMVPSGIDELEGFPLNNNNNHPKGRCIDGYSSPNSVPKKVTNVPLVTDLIGSSRMKKAYLSVGRSRPMYDLPLQDPSASLVPCSDDLVIERHQRVSFSSYDQMIVDSEMGSLTSSGSVRRPRSSRYKPFICQIPGCHRMFFRGSELYRHQREKHGARHVRPRCASLTYLSSDVISMEHTMQ